VRISVGVAVDGVLRPSRQGSRTTSSPGLHSLAVFITKFWWTGWVRIFNRMGLALLVEDETQTVDRDGLAGKLWAFRCLADGCLDVRKREWYVLSSRDSFRFPNKGTKTVE